MKENHESKSLTRIEPSQPSQSLTLSETMSLGQVFAQSGFFQDSKDQAQAIVKILAGRELGLPPVVSMTSIYIVKGRVTLSAQAMAAAIMASGTHTYRVRELTNQTCRIEFFSQGESLGDSSFSLEDAKAAGLSTDTWKKYPRNLLFARALSNGARWYCPHLLCGVYVPEEMGVPVNSEGEPVASPEPPRPAVRIDTAPVPAAEKRNGRPVGEPNPEAHPGEAWKTSKRRLHAMQKEAGLTDEQMKKLMKEWYGAESSTTLLAATIHDFADRIESSFLGAATEAAPIEEMDAQEAEDPNAAALRAIESL